MKKVSKILLLFLLLPIASCSLLNKYPTYKKATHYKSLPLIEGATKDYGLICNEYVNNLDIDFVSGEVTIESTTEYESIAIFETSEEKYKDKYVCHYYHEDDTYFLKYCKSNISIPNTCYKKLKVLIPETISLDSITINNVSSAISISNINVKDLSIKNVSGNVTLNKNQVKNISYGGVSGDLFATFMQITQKIDINLVSGNANIYLPSTTGGYSTTFEAVSGEFASDFADAKKYLDIDYLTINMKSVSGDLHIFSYESDEPVIEREKAPIEEPDTSDSTSDEPISNSYDFSFPESEEDSEEEKEGMSTTGDSGSWGDLE